MSNPSRENPRDFLAGLARLPRVLYIILALVLIGVAAWAAPRLAAGYYFFRAGQLLDQAWVDHNLIPCENPRALSSDLRTYALLAADVSAHALQWNPKSGSAQLMNARANCLADQPKAAARAYQGYLNSHPNDKLAELELGFALQAAGNLNKAAAAWEKTGQTAGEFVSTGQQALSGGDSARAEVWFQRALAMSPDDGDAWFGLGQIYEKDGQIEQAIKAYQAGMSGGSSASVNPLVVLYKKQENTEKYLTTLEAALNQFSDAKERLNWWQQWGENLRTLNQPEIASGIYQAALNEFPQDLDLSVGLAYSVFEAKNDTSKAIDILNKAHSQGTQDEILFFAAGDILSQAGKFSEADKWFKKAIEQDPNRPWWYWSRANNAQKLKDLPLAIAIDSDLINNFPDFEQGYLQLSSFLVESNQNNYAASVFDEAMDNISNPSINLLFKAGELYKQVGQISKALNAYQKILKIDPENNSANTYLDELLVTPDQ